MSPNPKDAMTTRSVSGNRGFTLTEVIVAIAIFITVISGVFALYSGAVFTVRTANQDLTLMAEARTSLKKVQDDLTVAYTGREFGDPNQFYGRPEGFMFIGKLSGGGEGRVTYVINPHASTETFTSELVESYQDTLERVASQVYDRAYYAALAAGLGNNAAKDFGQNNADQAEAAFRNSFAEPFDPDNSTPRNEGFFEFPVIVTTYALLRYEEQGVTDIDAAHRTRDLDTFQLPDDMSVLWPYFDYAAEEKDVPEGDSGPSDALYYFIKAGLGDRSNDPYATNPINGDMRTLMADVFSSTGLTNYLEQNDQVQLYALSPATVKTIIENKRREYWIRLLADDPAVVRPEGGVNPEAYGWSPRFWNNNADATTDRPYAKDYVLTEKILNRATLLSPVDGQPLTYYFNDPATGNSIAVQLDGLKVPGIFNYGFDKTEFAEANAISGYLNTLERLDGYMNFYNDPTPLRLAQFDQALQGMMASGGNATVNAGSPIVPRLPALVQIRFWLCDEKVLPNAPDFRRLFTQLIQVPAGVLPTNTTQTAQAN